MSKAILLWAILATVLSAIFVWRYESKECEVVNITNIVDTAVIYIPVGSGAVVDNNGLPGLRIPKMPSVIAAGGQKRFILMPQITLGNEHFGTSLGIQGIYLADRWSIGYTYDFMLKSHTIGFGWRF